MQAGVETYARFTPGWSPANDFGSAQVEQTARAFAVAWPDAFARVAVGGDGMLDGVVLWLVPAPDRASRDGWLPAVHLRWLFVAERRWGDGLAHRLHDLAVRAMRESGARDARLYTPRGHARARSFYEREGWRSRLPAFHDDVLGLEILEHELPVGSPPS